MKIVFIYRGAENIGIEYISSILKSKGHEVYLLFDPAVFYGDVFGNSKLFYWAYNVDAKIIRKTIGLKPDLVGFSAYTGNYRWCLNIAQGIKKVCNIPIVFGGVHTTAVPERVLANEFIDFAIIGEGEYAMLDLIQHLENGNSVESLLDTPNICFRHKDKFRINLPRPYIQDLDVLPFPDKMLFYDKVPMFEEAYHIVTSRGCPFSCSYCCNDMCHKIYCNEDNHVRRRSPDNVIEELMFFKKRGRVKCVYFIDDVFALSKSWLVEFIPKYRLNIDLPFTCSVHPLTVTQEKALLLKEGGCRIVTMGVQSGSKRIREEVFKRRGDNDKIAESVFHIKNAGIKISVDNIFGAPSETEEDLRVSFDFYKKLKSDLIYTFWLTYYPKTSIITYANSSNCLSEQDVGNIEQGYTGLTCGIGSVSKEKVKLYYKYELLFHIRSLVHNDKLFNVLSKFTILTPFKRLTTRIIRTLTAFVNKDFRYFYWLKYMCAKKDIP